MPVSKILTSKSALFAQGAVSVGVWKVAVPIVGSVLRPAFKEAIKGGLLLGR